MLKITTIVIFTIFVAFATIFCSAYPVGNDTLNNVSSKPVDVTPKYHIRINIYENAIPNIFKYCFGALVHPQYIVAPKIKCLEYKDDYTLLVYEGRMIIDDEKEGVQPTYVKNSDMYNIGVIQVKPGFDPSKVITLRIKKHHLPHDSKVEMYGFGRSFTNNRKLYDTMQMSDMITVERKRVEDCFSEKLEDYLLTIVSSTLLDEDIAFDNGNPIVFTNEKNEERLSALVVQAKLICTIGKSVFLGIELNEKSIAEEIFALSYGNIHR